MDCQDPVTPYPVSDYYKVKLMQTVFEVPSRYTNLTYHGSGAFSCVCAAYDTKLDRKVAIKKLSKPFYDTEYAKRTYREIVMLGFMNHPNIICLIDVFSPQIETEVNDIYLVTPWMDADLKHVLKQYGKLSEDHVRFFAYQMLLALRYLHAANIIHRDIKPPNLAINQDNDLKILDFGLARKLEEHMTGYVVTRWYRGPEVLVNWEHYSLPVDLWSIGCVIAELLTGKPLFPGDDAPSLITLMCRLLGKPNDAMFNKIRSESAAQFIRELQIDEPMHFPDLFPEASDEMISLLKGLLVFDPDDRLTAEQALSQPIFLEFAEETAKSYNFPTEVFDCSFEEVQHSVSEWKAMAKAAILNFHPKLDSLHAAQSDEEES